VASVAADIAGEAAATAYHLYRIHPPLLAIAAAEAAGKAAAAAVTVSVSGMPVADPVVAARASKARALVAGTWAAKAIEKNFTLVEAAAAGAAAAAAVRDDPAATEAVIRKAADTAACAVQHIPPGAQAGVPMTYAAGSAAVKAHDAAMRTSFSIDAAAAAAAGAQRSETEFGMSKVACEVAGLAAAEAVRDGKGFAAARAAAEVAGNAMSHRDGEWDDAMYAARMAAAAYLPTPTGVAIAVVVGDRVAASRRQAASTSIKPALAAGALSLAGAMVAKSATGRKVHHGSLYDWSMIGLAGFVAAAMLALTLALRSKMVQVTNDAEAMKDT
jgi:hypothetical protein